MHFIKGCYASTKVLVEKSMEGMEQKAKRDNTSAVLQFSGEMWPGAVSSLAIVQFSCKVFIQL